MVVLACVLRATTKKVVNFLSCPPQIFPLETPLLLRGKSLNSGPRNSASINYERPSIVRRKMCFDILNRYGEDHACDKQTGTGRQTDRQTDGRTEPPSTIVQPNDQR